MLGPPRRRGGVAPAVILAPLLRLGVALTSFLFSSAVIVWLIKFLEEAAFWFLDGVFRSLEVFGIFGTSMV